MKFIFGLFIFWASTAFALNFTDTKLGRAQVDEASFVPPSQKQFETCASGLKIREENGQKSTVCNDLALEEVSKFLNERAQPENVIALELPTELKFKLQSGCEASIYNVGPFDGRGAHQQFNLTCPGSVSDSEIAQIIRGGNTLVVGKKVSVLLKAKTEWSQPASLIQIPMQLDETECLANLSRDANDVFECTISVPAEINDIAGAGSLRASDDLAIPSLLKFTEIANYNTIKIDLKSGAQGSTIRVWAIDFDDKMPALTEELREEFKRALKVAGHLVATVAVPESRETSRTKTDLNIFERSYVGNTKNCLEQFASWMEWAGCSVSEQVELKDRAFKSIDAEETQIKLNHEGKTYALSASGTAMAVSSSGGSSGSSVYLHNDFGYAVRIDRFGVKVTDQLAKTLIGKYLDTKPKLSTLLVK